MSFLGETVVTDATGTPYEGFGRDEWALEFIAAYGQIDGAHHKQWVLDQVARILHGAPVILTVARWSSGDFEYRFSIDKPPQNYHDWVRDITGEPDENGECEYGYETGIAP